MRSAHGTWTVVIDGRPHQVAAEWDLTGTGAGSISIDGEVAQRWSIGMKWPGAQRRFVVAGRELVIAKRGVLDSELDLYACEPGLGWPVAPSAPKGWLVLIGVLVVLLLVAFAIVAMTQVLR